MAGPTTSPASSPSSSPTDDDAPGVGAALDERIARAVAAWPEGPSDIRQLDRLTGDASNRIYVRVHLAPSPGADGPTIMAMVMPLEPAGSEELGGGGEPAGELPFVTLARWLGGRGLPVPDLYHWAAPVRVLLLEDLGDITLERALEDPADAPAAPRRLELYRRAVDLLVQWQRRTDCPDDPVVRGRPAMDRSVLEWELEHYVQWRLSADLGLSPGPWQAALSAAFEPLLDALCALPTRLIHRDFQSRNLMCDEAGNYRLIDFQDAMRGPYVYDLVALLRDSYVELTALEVDGLVTRYAEAARAAGVIDAEPEAVRHHFDLMTVQRKLKDTGRFVFIDRVKGNPSFLPYRAPSMRYVWAALPRLDELDDLRRRLEQLDPPAPAECPS